MDNVACKPRMRKDVTYHYVACGAHALDRPGKWRNLADATPTKS